MGAKPRLLPSQVADIRTRYAAPMRPTLTELGAEYGVSYNAIHKIISRYTYKGVL